MPIHDTITFGQCSRRRSLDGCNVLLVDYAGGDAFDWHAHHRSNISFILAGGVREHAECHDAFDAHHSGAVVLKPAHVLHCNEFERAGAKLLTIELDDSLADRLGIDAAHPMNYRWLFDCDVMGSGLRLLDVLAQTSNRSSVRHALQQLVNALVEGRASGTLKTESAPCWLHATRQQLQRSAGDTITINQLARDAGIHPVSLNRAFRRHFGCCISSYRQTCRLRVAAQLLADSSQTLSQVALDAGFADQSHLTRAFRRHYHVTPSRYRQIIRNN